MASSLTQLISRSRAKAKAATVQKVPAPPTTFLVIDGPYMGCKVDKVAAMDTVYRILDGHRVGDFICLSEDVVRAVVRPVVGGESGGGCQPGDSEATSRPSVPSVPLVYRVVGGHYRGAEVVRVGFRRYRILGDDLEWRGRIVVIGRECLERI